MIDSSSIRVEERLTDNSVVEVQILGEPLLGYGLLIELEVSLCKEIVVGLTTCRRELAVLAPPLLSGSAHGRCLLTSCKVKSRRMCWKVKNMEVEERVNVRMRLGDDDETTKAKSCVQGTVQQTRRTLTKKRHYRTNKQAQALTSLQLFS